MEHSPVCSVEKGGAEGGRGLGLFKATNKLIGEAPARARCILGVQKPRMADLIACLLNTQSCCCVVKRGEGGRSAR